MDVSHSRQVPLAISYFPYRNEMRKPVCLDVFAAGPSLKQWLSNEWRRGVPVMVGFSFGCDQREPRW